MCTLCVFKIWECAHAFVEVLCFCRVGMLLVCFVVNTHLWVLEVSIVRGAGNLLFWVFGIAMRLEFCKWAPCMVGAFLFEVLESCSCFS